MSRDAVWSRLPEPWDLLIIGGGITGAGILKEATRLGLKALLVEQRDFAWGTSSRSSKLVHGGLRYLGQGKIGLTRDSVHERERLLHEGPGLIEPLGFLLANYEGDSPGPLAYAAGLSVYDLLAGSWSHRSLDAEEVGRLAPRITSEKLQGGYWYHDAETDDARLVLRVLLEAAAAGAVALNYVTAAELLVTEGQVAGARLRDEVTGRTAEARARLVVNATGTWADRLRAQLSEPARIRPLRGSHILFPAWRFPAPQAISFLHPRDRRPIFVLPWEGATLVGTTDLDHDRPLDEEPSLSEREAEYLMASLAARFPARGLTLSDAHAAFSGVRPVVGTGQTDPSKESRDYVVWEEKGLLTVTGGKLTTFRLIALDALRAARHRLPDLPQLGPRTPILDPVSPDLPGAEALDAAARRRLLGRYGARTSALVKSARDGELEPVPMTPVLWAELRHAARTESVVRLEDLLLRRVRLGLLLPEGGRELLPRIRAICQPELGWDDARWEREVEAYLELVRTAYGVPATRTAEA